VICSHKGPENKPLIGLPPGKAQMPLNAVSNRPLWAAGNPEKPQKPDSTESFKYFAKFA
jgi:hypothetical protein